MKIYKYRLDTKEYTGAAKAEADPAETKAQGEFVPLVPANATLIEPPETGLNEVAVFNSDSWEVKKDYRKELVCDSDFNISTVDYIGEIKDGYILITSEQAEKIQEDDLYYIIQDDEIVINPNYEAEKSQREQDRINNLTMTPLDFINVLVGFGLTLDIINAYLEANLSVKMQLTYCNSVYCGVAKSLMPVTIEGITITADMVEQAFVEKEGS